MNWPWLSWLRGPWKVSPDELVTRIVSASERGRHWSAGPWVRLLTVRLRFQRVALTAAQVQQLAESLAGLRLVLDPDQVNIGLTTLRTHLLLGTYHELILACGPVALGPMAWLLAQPPLGAGPINAGGGHMPGLTDVRGAKITALEVLRRHGGADHAPAAERLMGDRDEDPWTRCAAGVALLGWAGPSVANAVVENCLDPVLSDRQGMTWYESCYGPLLAGGGAALVPPLIARLGDPTYRIRQRAALVLSQIGEPAADDLAAVIRAGRSFEEVANAEMALRRIAPDRLLVAQRAREADSRSLSRAEPPAADPSRGLSRADP